MSDEAQNQARSRSMMRESGKLSALTMLSRVLGLLREITRTTLLGTSALGESFTVAFATPNLFRRLLAEGVMSTALIPTMKTYFDGEDEAETRTFLSAAFTALMFVTAAVVALGMAGSLYIALAYGLMKTDSAVVQNVSETSFLIRLMFPYLALVSAGAFLQGILNSRGSFVPSGIGPILFNLSFLLVPPLLVYWVPNPARAMALGVLVGGVLQALCQLPSVLKMGVRFGLVSLPRAFSHPGVKKVLLLMAPTLLGMAAYELNSVVSTGLAYGVGAAVTLQISLRLQELILGLFVVSIGTVMLPELSGLAARQDWQRFRQHFERSLEVVILVTLPIVVFSLMQRVNIVAVLFQGGEFDAAAVAETADIFLFHSLGLLFIALNRIITPAFYACADTKGPAWAGITAFVVNILLAWLFSLRFKGNGIALALSVASLVNLVLLLVLLIRKPIGGLGPVFGRSLLYALRLLLISAVAAVPTWFAGRWLQPRFAAFSSRLLFAGAPLVLTTVLYGGIGIFLLWVTRDRVAGYLVAVFSRKSHR
ncbi:MAG: murein biosynthesis integral membrane protein MurJ [Spirochaetes bacterium]|nr:murein biosynthesis integral membrane protein MurJ [Spirochaetota bacterium]